MFSSERWQVSTLICLTVLVALTTTADCGREILLATQQPLTFVGNMTLMVEDVDPQGGKVWLSLYGERGSLKSEILGVGGHFIYRGVTRVDLTVTKIYAGEGNDLVALQLNDGILLDTGTRKMDTRAHNDSEDAPVKNETAGPAKVPGLAASEAALSALALMWLLRGKLLRGNLQP